MKITPLLYKSTFTPNTDTIAIGSLPDALSCKVTEERNGEYYLEMTYPAMGMNANLLQVGLIITARPNIDHGAEPFRIATIEKHLDGTMNITAYHISYDLGNVVVMPFSATSLTDALTGFVSNGTPANSFTFRRMNAGGYANFAVTAPKSLRSCLMGSEGSVVDTWPIEYDFRGWTVFLYTNRGSQKNITIAYGKNLSSFTETDELGAYDAVVPYAVVNDTTYYITDTAVCATAPVVQSSTSYGYPKTIVVDFSDRFTDTAPTDQQLYDLATAYISGHSTASTANMATSFVDLQKLLGSVEDINLCDTIYLSVAPYNIEGIKLKVVRTVYDCLLDEYESIQVGDKKVTLADTLATLIGETS